MKRTDYIELCRKAAIKRDGNWAFVKDDFPKELLVEWDSGTYVPVYYQLGFNFKGEVTHTCILQHTAKPYTIVYVELAKVKEVGVN